ncbi:helix-turn-helix transcriptional regulator [Capnocytophaga genosp. AHN8471]|jgi:transcriptional regulator, XRE family|uniref:Helix-turn-helix transcriptional regulator n=1 Tax=Capnocytophaga genosp. AHN8471 TaxID=327574 RepID=A0ABS1YX81_9FLAO|nr:helix-turn-helix transcriptional regulator [Capnocytophaga genosp. AHN8471]MBM0651027.1 helix-turn-helix transcriptional regulator [Capnocytophaga genosp. AHN8471]MBM0661591.1 helix-turn-helix transcriptional regulator [Capnocytophaga genosp. AHN8471]
MLTPIEQFVIEKVRQIRNQKNISQAELAFAIGVSIGFIGKVESLKYNTKYNLNHLNSIAKALNISPQELLPIQSI